MDYYCVTNEGREFISHKDITVEDKPTVAAFHKRRHEEAIYKLGKTAANIRKKQHNLVLVKGAVGVRTRSTIPQQWAAKAEHIRRVTKQIERLQLKIRNEETIVEQESYWMAFSMNFRVKAES